MAALAKRVRSEDEEAELEKISRTRNQAWREKRSESVVERRREDNEEQKRIRKE